VRLHVATVPGEIERFLPEFEADASEVGINYADAFLKALKTILEDGRKVLCKRRGLEITIRIGDRTGRGLLRRLEHGPDVREILEMALSEAARNAGAELSIEDGTVCLEIA